MTNQDFINTVEEDQKAVLTSEYGPLNNSQQGAVIQNSKRNLVDASAGTGKTLTLKHRVLYLLSQGIPPERIVAITYLNDAADEMKTRIADEADVNQNDLNISTIHSFARKICMEYCSEDGTDISLGESRKNLIDNYVSGGLNNRSAENAKYPEIYKNFLASFQAFQRKDAEKNYIDGIKGYYETRNQFIENKFREFIKNARTFGLSSEEVRNQLDRTNTVAYKFGEAGSYLLEAYERVIESESTPTDFVDMITTATEIIEANPEDFKDRYDHVLVDEYQDISKSTLQFIDALVGVGDSTQLFCVGDDWQSIMGFAGSDVTYFTEFEDRYDDVSYTSLNINYRCPPTIVKAGVELISHSQVQQNNKSVRANKSQKAPRDEEPMQLHLLEGLYDNRVHVYTADLIEEALDNGHGFEDIMVLSRNDENSKYMESLREELKDRQIPHTRVDYTNDYIPHSQKESLDNEIEFTEKGQASFVNSEDEPPLVTLQSVHSSKGTEAPVVIFLHAVGNTPEGIPIEEQVDPLTQPAKDITAEHVPEERRLFYVGLTRAEECFKAVARPDGVSQFVEDIEHYFTKYTVNGDISGKCTKISPPNKDNQPYKITLDCGDYEAKLVGWSDEGGDFVTGNRYSISNPTVERDKYGEKIRFDKCEIDELS